MSEDARKRLADFFASPKDYLAGRSTDEKIAHLGGTSYRDYLRLDAGLGDEAVKFFEGQTLDYFAVGIDAVPAYDAMYYGYAGFAGLGIPPEDNLHASEPYIYHFPDGNASIARLLVRSLIPAAAAGSTMDDIVLVGFRLFEAGPGRPTDPHPPVQHRAQRPQSRPTPRGRSISAMSRRMPCTASRAKQCVLACYNMIIPHLMPELPEPQKEALAASVKAPLVYVNVAIRNWQSFAKLGVQQIYSPTAFFPVTKLDYPVALGGYRNPGQPRRPDGAASGACAG